MAILADVDGYQDLVMRLRSHPKVAAAEVVSGHDGIPVYCKVEMDAADTGALNTFKDEWGLRIGYAEITQDGTLQVTLGVED